jgi:hypothetical protein
VPSIAIRQCYYPEISALLPSPALLLVRAILEPNTDSMATAEEAECAYTYEPLEEPDQSIRLLKILSVTPRITCTFKVAHLKDSPVFSCLSYVWGDATITEPVTVEGKILHITVNLAGAIRDVHRQWSTGQLLAPGEEQWLWADALCINQKHDQEKNHQVPLMEQIYSSAERVFAWLGDEKNERASKAVDANNIILHAIRQLPGYEFIQGSVQDGRLSYSKQEILAEVGGEILGAITDLTWLTEHYTTQSVPGESHILSDAVELFRLPYWTRLWILQELVLARDAVLLCGPKKISWLEVCCVQFWIKLAGMKYLSADIPHSVPLRDWAVLMQLELPYEYILVCAFKKWASWLNHPQRQQLFSPVDSPNEATLKVQFKEARAGFCMTENALKYQVTDAKDYVYALGGVTGLRIPTDYSSETTIAQVYQEYAVRWMNSLAWGEVSERDPDHRIMCDLWFLAYAGIGSLWTPIPGLLSWVPNLKGVAECRRNIEDERYTSNFRRELGTFNDSGTFPQGTKRVTCLDSCICCSAVVIEESVSIGPTVQSCGELDKHSFEEDKWLLWIYDLITGQKDMLFSIVEALYSLEGGFKTLDKKDAALLLMSDLAYVCKKRRAMPSIDFYTALGYLSYPKLITDNSCSPTSRKKINLKRMQLDPVGKNEDRANADRMVSVSVAVYQHALRNLHNFRLASTSSGLFALFPPLTADGDIIWVLKGFTLPVVLRKHGDGYQFVGACSMPGLKKDDVASMIRDGQAPVKEIKIY